MKMVYPDKVAGVFVPGPDNPGGFTRRYGVEYTQHVVHLKNPQGIYNAEPAEFKK